MNKAARNSNTDCRCGVSDVRSSVVMLVYYKYAVRYFVYCIFSFFGFPVFSHWMLSDIAI